MDKIWEGREFDHRGNGWAVSHYAEFGKKILLDKKGRERKAKVCTPSVYVECDFTVGKLLTKQIPVVAEPKALAACYNTSTLSDSCMEFWMLATQINMHQIFGCRVLDAVKFGDVQPKSVLVLVIEVCPSISDNNSEPYYITANSILCAMVITGDEVENLKLDREKLALEEFLWGATSHVFENMYGNHSARMVLISHHAQLSDRAWEKLCSIANVAVGGKVCRANNKVRGEKTFDPSMIFADSYLANSDRMFIPDVLKKNLVDYAQVFSVESKRRPLCHMTGTTDVAEPYMFKLYFNHYHEDGTRAVIGYIRATVDEIKKRTNKAIYEELEVFGLPEGLRQYRIEEGISKHLVEYMLLKEDKGYELDINMTLLVHPDLQALIDRFGDSARKEFHEQYDKFVTRFEEAVYYICPGAKLSDTK